MIIALNDDNSQKPTIRRDPPCAQAYSRTESPASPTTSYESSLNQQYHTKNKRRLDRLSPLLVPLTLQRPKTTPVISRHYFSILHP